MMLTLVRTMNETEDTRNETEDTSIIQLFNKMLIDHSFYGSTRIDHIEILSVEQRASLALLVKISEQMNNYREYPVNTFDQILPAMLGEIYKVMKNLKIIINPNKSVRDILELICDHNIISAGMICCFTGNSRLRSKNTVLNYLRQLNRAGVLTRYSTQPLVQAIRDMEKKPLASLRRTELYGFPNQSPKAYGSVVSYYAEKTKDAYISVEEKEEVRLIKKAKKSKVIRKLTIKRELEKLSSGETLDHYLVGERERKITQLQQELEELND